MNRTFAGLAYLAVLQALLCFIAPLWAAAEDKIVYLTVSVSDDQGNPVGGVRINVHQANSFTSTIGVAAFRRGVVVPPDYQAETSGRGLAPIKIKVASNQKL